LKVEFILHVFYKSLYLLPSDG